jgi:hypothetical protein
MKARKPEVHTAIGRVTFHFRPSAIDGRFDIEFETGAPTYVRFGAVLTRREVLALIECLGAGLRDGEQGEQ